VNDFLALVSGAAPAERDILIGVLCALYSSVSWLYRPAFSCEKYNYLG